MVVVAKHLPVAERICNKAGKRASACLDSKGLALAAHKTKAVLISSGKKVGVLLSKLHLAQAKNTWVSWLTTGYPPKNIKSTLGAKHVGPRSQSRQLLQILGDRGNQGVDYWLALSHRL